MKKPSTKKTTSTSAAAAPAKKAAPAARKAPVTPAVKKTVPKAVVTTISARIDIGFGNTLYLRGEGPGLSWDKGVVMECTGEDQWTLVLPESARPIVFKFLHNDEVWSVGEDYTAKPGASVVFAPVF
jgi:hypothetical protein